MQVTPVTLRSAAVSTVSAGPSLARAFVAAAEAIGRVSGGESLNAALADLKRRASAQTLAAAAQDLCYNALRGYGVVDVALERLLQKPLTDSPVRGLLLAALAELVARPRSAHAVVHQAVEAAALLGHSRAKGLVNAVMRNFQRRMPELLLEIEATESGRYRHPQWWIDALRLAYPRQWESVLLESNRHPPMVLRVNRRRLSAKAYLEKLDRAGIPARALGQDAVLLEKPCRVERLPGFAAGEVSVQDAGAQRAAPLLDVRDGMRVLDACAAPGGKTGHLLELAECELLAVDADGVRARRIAENLARLKLSAKVVIGDCRKPEGFWGGRPFDRILLDAPCSASGVVRRHPDIKWLRRKTDASEFGHTQAELLEALWRVLGPDGKLLYATCSVFPEENGAQVENFLAQHPEAEILPLPGLGDGNEGAPRPFECQILPSADSDGFFYALLKKTTVQAEQ
ncbi:MAG TPA: 16S rRNA (cytosine(967)-C(5))-methyltransferase RsmB [Burkholderiales bacterium]|nr:16S rRNA (cytosine(967)-C(5))-methyltransferase RsmB [Burkholderiales bacterium]